MGINGMNWNYRVMRLTEGKSVSYGIHEVYYDSEGNVKSFSEDRMAPYGETPSELKTEVERFTMAFEKPILDYNELEKKFESERTRDGF